MNLLRCHILGFGKLSDLDLTLVPGLNVVFAPNEAGKSTLQQFLVGALYGPFRPGVRTQRRLESWTERFKPWRGADYGGIVWCELSDGAQLEIHRSFGRDESRLEIRAASGEDLTRRYAQQKNSDVLFARALLGMPKELFESVSVIRENRAAELDSSDSIRDRIANLAATGDEEQSVQLSLRRLDEALETIGSDRAPTRPLRQAQERLAALGAERAALGARREEFAAWARERELRKEEIGRLEQDLEAARRRVLRAQWRDAARTVRSLEEIAARLAAVRNELAGSKSALDFPAGNLDELNRLAGSSETLEERVAETRRSLAAALERHERARAGAGELAEYGAFDPEAEPQRITEALVRFAGLSAQRGAVEAAREQERRQAAALGRSLEGLPAVVREASTDWEAAARQAAEVQRAASQACLALSAELVARTRALGEVRRELARHRTLGAAALVAAGIFLLARVPALGRASLVFALAFAGVGVVELVRFGRKRAFVRGAREEIRALEEDEARRRKEAGELPEDLRRALTASGASGLDEFLAAARKGAELRRRLAEAEGRAAKLECDAAQIEAGALEAYAALAGPLAGVGLRAPRVVAEVKAAVETFRRNLRRFRQLEAEREARAREVASLEQAEAGLAGELASVRSRIEAILTQSGVESTVEFRESCRARERAIALRERAASLEGESERLRGSMTLAEWRARLDALAVEIADPEGPEDPPGLDAGVEEKRAAARLRAALDAQARLEERLSQAFENYRTVSEIEEDLAEANAALQRLARNRAAFELARDTLAELEREQQKVLAPQLNYAIEARFARLCGGAYSEVKVDPDFQIWVREGTSHELRSVEDLSRGTRDQLYLALRFSVLDLVSAGFEPSPCLLDEPFAAYDHERLEAAFEVVREEAGRRQIILFTCREDVHALALRSGGWVVELPETRRVRTAEGSGG
ncbi:MAG: hypothetical protein DMG07_07610 [Acidobacteria bacterium]|nr:MAG: hypothetical protein DMG07_07610 [Acidobacteriota bacterium]